MTNSASAVSHQSSMRRGSTQIEPAHYKFVCLCSQKLSSEGVTHVLCSSGCGVRPGAPIITHTMEGRFELMGLAAGGAPCSHRSMRRRLNDEPPLYIDVFPYASWIINVISAHKIPKAYPETFQLTDGGSRKFYCNTCISFRSIYLCGERLRIRRYRNEASLCDCDCTYGLVIEVVTKSLPTARTFVGFNPTSDNILCDPRDRGYFLCWICL